MLLADDLVILNKKTQGYHRLRWTTELEIEKMMVVKKYEVKMIEKCETEKEVLEIERMMVDIMKKMKN
jgi:hypothetical protein